MLAAGARLGPYEVLGLLGAGGMGEVYRARDTRLGRAVAVKVLTASVAEDEGRRRRFEEEARAAGALNHPNVLAVYDVGRENGVLYVVSELLEGQTLRDRLDGPLPIRKATDYAIQIAHGLAAAHGNGIVHRDLKPENLFLTPDGHVKILDFGLAKRDAPPSADGETASTRGLETDPGTIQGTVSYMSPEQVRGQRVDHRSDLFSLGVVLYEMLAGRRPFKGATAADTTSAILKEEPPDLLTERPDLNPALERIVRRCLEKEASGRFQSAQDLAFALQTVSGAGVTDSAATTTRAPRRRRRTLGTGALALAALLATSAGVTLVRRGPPTAVADLSAYRFTPLATEPGYEGSAVWSADGQNVAYLGEKDGVLQVFTRGLGASTSAQITNALRDCKEPFWSADGRRLFYVSLAGESEGLWSVGAAGGAPELMLHNVSAAAVSRDGRTLFLLREESHQGDFLQALWTSTPAGTEPVRYAEPPLADKRFARGFLRMAPDGRKLGLWAAATSDERAGEAGYANPQFWIVPAGSGPPVRALEALPRMPDPAPFSWMPDSRHIVFAAEFRDKSPGTHLWWADTQSGRSSPLTATSGSEHYPSVSPDGRRLAFTEHAEDYDLVAVPLDGRPLQTVLSTSRTEIDPAWSPVGDQYAYVTNRAGRDEIWMRSRDGTLERPLVIAASFQGSETFMLGALAFSSDGQRLAYQRRGPAGFRIWISAVAGGPAVQLAADDSYQDAPTWSPDGEWIAFVFRRQTRWGLAKARVGGGSAPVVLKEGIVYPSNPRWSPAGEWITCDMREGFSVVSTKDGSARVLSEDTPLAHGWSRDGARVFAARPAEGGRLELVAIELATGAETVVSKDLGPSPPSDDPLRGFSLAPDGKSFLTSILRLRGDLWIIEGFEPRPRELAQRLFGPT
jgi:Tol biopolymer transport system component